MSKRKSKDSKEQGVSMKEAFDKVVTKDKKREAKIAKQKETSIRDFFWNYPEAISKFFKLTTPFSTIVLFAVLGFGLSTFLRSEAFAEKISSRKLNYYVEGRVGAISTFNPLFSNQNDVDKAVQELVFEKFIHIDTNGNILPGIATSWDISSDGKIYEFDIDLNHTWSDGEPLTIEDVYFTFDTAIKLSTEQGYDTVASGLVNVDIRIIDDDSIEFVLPEINAIFPELVSIYIVPEHVLKDISLKDLPFDRFSRNPVGSGPYMVYRSEPNIVYLQKSEYYQPSPNISNIVMRIYSEVENLESAFRNGLLDAALLPNNSQADFVKEYSSYSSHELDLPYRQRILFFNLRKEKFQNEYLRKGISLLIDKEELLEKSGINAEIAYGPIYEKNWAYSSTPDYPVYDVQKAKEQLKEAGFTQNEVNGYFEDKDGKLLTFTITYLDNKTNNQLLNTLKEILEDEGVIVNLEPLNYFRITQEILATRNFEVLMYDVEVTVDPDQYNLWHSLQKEYPNLNLSGYEFSRVDILLEDGRREIDKEQRKEEYALFQKYLMDDMPAIFLYRPSYIYVVRDVVEGIHYENMVRLEDIYSEVYNWKFIQ
jgi:peptide/nickel transport system substrate-binding protein